MGPVESPDIPIAKGTIIKQQHGLAKLY